jgi:hypothetical protein
MSAHFWRRPNIRCAGSGRDVSAHYGLAATDVGASIIGYGQYHDTYAIGREGDGPATGFSAQKARLSLYIMPGYRNLGSILDWLGKHKKAKACVYINTLADVDMAVVEEIVRAGLDDLATHWPVKAS